MWTDSFNSCQRSLSSLSLPLMRTQQAAKMEVNLSSSAFSSSVSAFSAVCSSSPLFPLSFFPPFSSPCPSGCCCSSSFSSTFCFPLFFYSFFFILFFFSCSSFSHSSYPSSSSCSPPPPPSSSSPSSFPNLKSRFTGMVKYLHVWWCYW